MARDNSTKTDYALAGGLWCPACRGPATAREPQDGDVVSGGITRPRGCPSCGATWNDTLALTGYSDLEVPTPPGAEQTYRVEYQIDVEARSAEEAALLVSGIMVDPEAMPPVLDVIPLRDLKRMPYYIGDRVQTGWVRIDTEKVTVCKRAGSGLTPRR